LLLRRVRPDVLYVSTVTAPLWLVVGRMLGCRVVCHVHEGEASATRTLLRALNAPLFLAHRLLINSSFSRDVLARAYPGLAARSEVVYNSIPGPDRVEPARRSLDGGCRLLYVGRLSPRKGPDVALAALAVLRDRGVAATLDLVGAVFPGYEWFDAQLVRQVETAQLADVVRFHGFQRDVWPYAAAADVVLVPSTVDEPFGNTAVEAALAARPSVISDLAGLKEARFGLSAAVPVPPGDAEAIADAVQAVIANWADLRTRAAEDAGFAAARYSRKTYADSVLALFEGVRRPAGIQS
jgi:glycosyltransferase involved in cell wall biosynthesis